MPKRPNPHPYMRSKAQNTKKQKRKKKTFIHDHEPRPRVSQDRTKSYLFSISHLYLMLIIVMCHDIRYQADCKTILVYNRVPKNLSCLLFICSFPPPDLPCIICIRMTIMRNFYLHWLMVPGHVKALVIALMMFFLGSMIMYIYRVESSYSPLLNEMTFLRILITSLITPSSIETRHFGRSLCRFCRSCGNV
jgi:hypothetical protein